MRVAASVLPLVLLRSDLATSFFSLLLIPEARTLPFLSLLLLLLSSTADFPLLPSLELRLRFVELRLELLESVRSAVAC